MAAWMESLRQSGKTMLFAAGIGLNVFLADWWVRWLFPPPRRAVLRRVLAWATVGVFYVTLAMVDDYVRRLGSN